MSSFVSSTDIGMEQIAREGALILIDQINDELAVTDAFWQQMDIDLAAAQGITYYECISDQVESRNVHPGHRPSFIERGAEDYPNINVMSFQSNPSGFSNYDQGEDVSVTFYIEFMVKSGPFEPDPEGKFIEEGEILVNKRAQRMGETIHRIISGNKTLNGLISGFEGAPSVKYTDCMRRTDTTSGGEYDYYWSMGRIEYKVSREINTYY